MRQTQAKQPGFLKNLKTSSNGRYKSLQGTYNPRIGGPYKGPTKKPVFRSKIELRLMTMLDNPNATNVVGWKYEARKIPYIDKSTVCESVSGIKSHPLRHYIIDFIVDVKNPAGGISTFWIETKSINDIVVAKKHRSVKNAKVSNQIRAKNLSKWIAASNAAKAVGAKFVVITENELEMLKNIIYGGNNMKS